MKNQAGHSNVPAVLLHRHLVEMIAEGWLFERRVT